MTLAAAVIVVAFALALISFAIVAFASPAVAGRFVGRFASSARAHYTEQIVRVLVGSALVVRSPAMWQSRAFWLFGWAIVMSSTALLCIPWQWHHRLGRPLLPKLIRYLKLYAVGSFVLGAALLYAVFEGKG